MPSNEVYNKIRTWVNDVRGKIVGQKRRPVHRAVPINWTTHDGEKAMAITDSIETETVIVVEIPIRELSTMAETQDWYQRNLGGYSLAKFDHHLRERHIEESLREQHPGLQDLWEQYKEMLALCDDETFR